MSISLKKLDNDVSKPTASLRKSLIVKKFNDFFDEIISTGEVVHFSTTRFDLLVKNVLYIAQYA